MPRRELPNLLALASEQRRRRNGSFGPTEQGKTEASAVTERRSPETPYLAQEGRIVRRRMTRYGPVDDVLAYFDARIVEELVEDDGAERRRYLRIEGRLPDGRPLERLTVPAEEYPAMTWVSRAWGARAVVAAGPSRKDALREAILHLSGQVPQRLVYAHTGWRRIDGRWVFLHAGGAIGHRGVTVQLPEHLQRFRLPDPPDPEAAVAAVRTSLRLLDLAPQHPEVGYALLSTVYRAPLSHFVPTTVILWLYGPSGSFKTSTATLALSHFGAFDESTPPETWLSTPNALETTLWTTADLPVLIDDFAPGRFRHEAERLQDSAEQLIRRIGNHAGRHRLRADLSSTPDRPPRGAVLVTAEELPSTRLSALARILPVPVQPGTIDVATLTLLQRAQDELGRAGAAYVQWLAGVLNRAAHPQQELAQVQQALRRKLAGSGHPRVAANVAVMGLGLHTFLAFAQAIGAIDPSQQAQLYETGLSALARLGESHQRLLEDDEPALKFLEAIDELLASGKAVLLPRASQPQQTPAIPPGAVILGYADARFAYLLPDVAFDSAQRLLASGRGLGSSPRAVWQALERRGFLVRDDPEHLLTKLQLPNGRRVRVLRVVPHALPFLSGADAPVPPNDTGATGASHAVTGIAGGEKHW